MKSNTKETKTTKTSEELLNSTEQTNKLECNSDELLSYYQVENTPFTIVNEQNERYWVTMGKYRISEPFTTADEALEDAKRADWFRMMDVMSIMIEEYKPTKN